MTPMPAGLLFPTMVVGSLPRPQWVKELIEERKSGKVSPTQADQLLDSVVPSALKMQERAGLDFISDGEWRRESYVKVFAEAVDGFQSDLVSAGNADYPDLRYPAVVSQLSPHRSIAASEVEFIRRHSDSRIVVALPSAYTIARRMWDPEHSSSAYPSREGFMDTCIPIVRAEIETLIDFGVDAIQLDDPWLALLVDPDYRRREGIDDVDREIELSVRSVNQAVEGIEGAFLSVHLCHTHFNRSHSTKGSYELIIEALGRMKVDRFAIEFATPDAGGVDVLRHFPADKILGLGVIDHTDNRVETPELVVERVERAMEFVPKERITLNPDCGFSPSSVNPMDLDEAYLKLKAMCDAASMLRTKYA